VFEWHMLKMHLFHKLMGHKFNIDTFG
jgi:hypothetical protein